MTRSTVSPEDVRVEETLKVAARIRNPFDAHKLATTSFLTFLRLAAQRALLLSNKELPPRFIHAYLQKSTLTLNDSVVGVR